MPDPQETTLELAIAERNAALFSLRHVLQNYGVPFDHRWAHIAYTCLAIAAEAWARAHPEVSEEDGAALFAEMAREALVSYHDGMAVVLARRGAVKGESHHA